LSQDIDPKRARSVVSNTNMKIVALIDGELAKSRQQTTDDLTQYMRETRTAITDVSQAAEPKP
jgi:hypothetical protein